MPTPKIQPSDAEKPTTLPAPGTAGSVSPRAQVSDEFRALLDLAAEHKIDVLDATKCTGLTGATNNDGDPTSLYQAFREAPWFKDVFTREGSAKWKPGSWRPGLYVLQQGSMLGVCTQLWVVKELAGKTETELKQCMSKENADALVASLVVENPGRQYKVELILDTKEAISVSLAHEFGWSFDGKYVYGNKDGDKVLHRVGPFGTLRSASKEEISRSCRA